MLEIVWVYGSSASGKATFVQNITKNSFLSHIKYFNLKKALGWRNKILIPIKESLIYVSQYKDDPISKKREEIIEIVSRIITNCKDKNNSIILIKGQDIDYYKFNSLIKLNDRFPEVKHKIIFLHCDIEILYTRVKKKSWWNENLEKEGINYIKNFLKDFQLPYLLNLDRNKFQIISLNSKNTKYKRIPFPPKID